MHFAKTQFLHRAANAPLKSTQLPYRVPLMCLSQALDDENAMALAAIREEWQKLLRDTEARNRKKLDVLAK